MTLIKLQMHDRIPHFPTLGIRSADSTRPSRRSESKVDYPWVSLEHNLPRAVRQQGVLLEVAILLNQFTYVMGTG